MIRKEVQGNLSANGVETRSRDGETKEWVRGWDDWKKQP